MAEVKSLAEDLAKVLFAFPKDGISLNVKVVGRINFEGWRTSYR